jgi:hypothetical protein
MEKIVMREKIVHAADYTDLSLAPQDPATAELVRLCKGVAEEKRISFSEAAQIVARTERGAALLLARA